MKRPTALFVIFFAAALGAASVRAEIREMRVRLPSLPPPTGAEQICEKRMVVPRTQGAESCFIDERVTRVPGVLRYPCSGDGWAKAAFGPALFLGRVDHGQVALTLNTEFDFSDHCTWSTEQTLRGALSSGGLDYAYTEHPNAGQRGCASSCRATARATFR